MKISAIGVVVAMCMAPVVACKSAVAPATVRGWARGELERTVEIDARGASLGLLLMPMNGETEGEGRLIEGSCAWDLVSILPAPWGGHEVFASDREGRLLRYADGQWQPVVASSSVPRVQSLLGFEAATSPLVMLVEERDSTSLWHLTIAGSTVTSTTQVRATGEAFESRRAFLEKYQVGRCHHSDRDCLFLSKSVDPDGISVYRQPAPGEERAWVMELHQSARDVAYVEGSGGDEIYALVARHCE